MVLAGVRLISMSNSSLRRDADGDGAFDQDERGRGRLEPDFGRRHLGFPHAVEQVGAPGGGLGVRARVIEADDKADTFDLDIVGGPDEGEVANGFLYLGRLFLVETRDLIIARGYAQWHQYEQAGQQSPVRV